MAPNFDLTTREGVVALMESSTNEAAWDANCDAVKMANARDGRPGYPPFWYAAVIASDLAFRVRASWPQPGSPSITITCL